jgi:hypothetical protein
MIRASLLALLVACGSSPTTGQNPDGNTPTGDGNSPQIDAPPNMPMIDAPVVVGGQRTIFVIPLENKSDAMIFGNTTDAPYINGLLATSAHATNMADELPSLDSEPHYIWMEAGTNVFSDHSFTVDNDASTANSTASTAHLVTQLTAAGKTWKAYQQGMTAGTCPITSTGEYAAKHGPFVFFRDVSGATPATTTAGCISHYTPIETLATDVAADTLPNYAFITPDLCHDMHGDLLCASGLSSSPNIQAGDTWLSTNLPPLIAYTKTHDATIFLVWDEGDATNLVPLIAIGAHVVVGTDATAYTHSSMLKTIEELLGVPALPSVTSSTDFAAMFTSGYL